MRIRLLLLACTALSAAPAVAQGGAAEILVTAQTLESGAATKTDTPALETPQPVTVISEETFTRQGAVSVSDTLNYVSGVQANPYGPDSRVDGAFVRGINALQFRDGMRDVFSYYASIRADPYNFSQVQVVRGPAGVMFGAGSLGGIVNLESKAPQFHNGGEVSVRYGSFDRKEVLADLNTAMSDTVAGRIVARVRDAGTQTDFVPDDRIMIAPSLMFAPSTDTELTLLGLYQEDDGGSTAQFLPLVGTLLPNPNGQLPSELFVGKPGWDRYDGRLLQGTALFTHRFDDTVRFNAKARYIDSDLTYLTHYANSYSNPTNPYLDPEQRMIGLYSDGSVARMEIFSTDNNVQLNFETGAGFEHVLLAGIDYSWNRVRKTSGFGVETIDIYDIDYDALSDWDGGLPPPSGPSDDTVQELAGFYIQDQIRLWGRVSLVLGARHDHVRTDTFGVNAVDAGATTYRAGIIAEVVKGVSPFFSYTESFEPVSGVDRDRNPLVPKSGRQYELGVKLHPNDATIVTLTGYHIKESNRPLPDNSTPDVNDDFIQVEAFTSKGVEFEAQTTLPGQVSLIANYSYNQAEIDGTGQQADNVPKHNASLWATRPFQLANEVTLLLGGGVRHTAKNRSYGPAFPTGIVTPGYTLVDAFAEVNWRQWSFALNATNLLGKDYYSACLARGDCFTGAERNVFGTVSYRF